MESEVLVEKEVLETVEVPVEKVVSVDKVIETPLRASRVCRQAGRGRGAVLHRPA